MLSVELKKNAPQQDVVVGNSDRCGDLLGQRGRKLTREAAACGLARANVI